jgi:hypothetical protein
VIVAGLTGRAGPIVFSPLPVSERRRMTNNADANQVVAFQRDPNGTLVARFSSAKTGTVFGTVSLLDLEP